jgi:hypothetical protein
MTNENLDQSMPSTLDQSPAPVSLVGTIITDAILKEAASQGGVPFQVQMPASPPADTNFYFKAHVIPGALQLLADITLQVQTLPANSPGGPTTIYVPTDSDMFKTNQTVVIYYWIQTSNRYPEISETLTVIVDRDSLKNQTVDPDLIAPMPVTYDFNSNFRGQPLTLRVNLGKKITPRVNDGIMVRLNMTGASLGDLNYALDLASLPEYFLTKDDIQEASPNVIVRFDGSNGDPQGFSPDIFAQYGKIKMYGELYFLYRPAGKNTSDGAPGTVVRSPSSWIKIDEW